MPDLNGGITAKFDGLAGGEVVDPKNEALPWVSESMIDEVRRQAGTAAYHDLKVVWKVPDAKVMCQSLQRLNDAGVTTVGARVAP